MKYLIKLLLLILSIEVQADPQYGIFMVVKGDVKVTSGTHSTTTIAKVGMKIFESDSVNAGVDSRAKIVMSDRNVINVNPESQFKIQKYINDGQNKEVKIDLSKGKLRTSVEEKYDGEKNKFEIKTPTAVAGVRGTRFLVGFDPTSGLSQVYTFHGVVTFASFSTATGVGPAVEVKKGQGTTVENGKAPEPPKDIPKDQMKKIEKDTQIDNSGAKENKPPMGQPNDSKRPDTKDSVKSPTSQPETSMLDQRDLNLANMNNQMKADIGNNLNQPPPPPPNFDPRNAPLMPPPPPDLIKDVISNTNSKTKVIINPVPQ